MRALHIVVPLVVAFGLTGCGSDNGKMPDVTGKKLDVAYANLRDAGFDDKDKIQVDGGGMLGVVVESNWTVCEQSPGAGEAVSDEPTLTVDRSCESEKEPTEETSEPPSETPSEETGDTASAAPTEEPSETPTEAPTPTQAPLPDLLTVKNSADLKAMLEADDDYSLNSAFAKKYKGLTIQFDGSIADASPGYFLVYFGDDSDTDATSGPAFQFRARSLQISGGGPAETGDNLRFVATVGTFNSDQGLFFLTLVKATTR